ncbi:ammonium transporter [Pseudohoeflea coraliihabitans]|uniref:Ammonium transporter n=1 Tax=Pseudohoeflea coraliihabitans TaxID=2860393 RepID=A0ABS6WLG9_9HYPH|nr:ammonium transporter [Pseudohoeflea sp. DP4N28-3]MBW3096803.1 ammonium transporter [Pseudohoeflea sp. DP4N28-3]
MTFRKILAGGSLALAAVTASALPVFAQEAEAATEAAAVGAQVSYIFNTLLFLIGGFLVMWMAAGFAMLEAGLVRSKNVSMQSLKNIALFAVAGLMYWIIGYNLMYSGVDGGYIGSFSLGYALDPVGGDALDTGYSTASDWFFQMVFVATAASIVSGTLAERIKLLPFMVFVVMLTGFIYPIAGSWQWGGGWLSEMGFSDFAGSTLVHSVGGWAALAGAFLLGARDGKYVNGRVVPMPGSSIPLATLGTFILWLGWFGFNGASQLAMGTIADVSDVSRIFVNTNMAAAGGVVTAMVLLAVMYKKVDVTMVLNGALAGLVSITAEPLAPAIWQSVVIGGIGAAIVIFTVPLLDKLKIDDVVGAIPVHLFAGIWGTLVVAWTNADASLVTQFIGVVAYGVFTVVCALVVWAVLKAAIGIRVSPEQERLGLDKAEVGVEAYPEFAQ